MNPNTNPSMNLENHPCFNVKAKSTYARVHLPVAPRCNIQCKFCNRLFDCVNESRPGVTSAILSPIAAEHYVDQLVKMRKNISVVGIAGPGDPFANPDETLETLDRIRRRFPEMLLCVASNGLNVAPYVKDLAKLKVSHVTLTINALTPSIGAKIYSWVRYQKRVKNAHEGAAILLERQMEAVAKLKEHQMTVKINSIILPGINDAHIPSIAKVMADMDVDIMNCVPYYPCKGSHYEDMAEPSHEMVKKIRKECSTYVKQMLHCVRCRSDAAGLLCESTTPQTMQILQNYAACNDSIFESMPENAPKSENHPQRIAVTTIEGVLINLHLGEAPYLWVYEKENEHFKFVEKRPTPEIGGGDQRWQDMADLIDDCQVLLVSGIGQKPMQILENRGIEIMQIEGLIEEAVGRVFLNKSISHLVKQDRKPCQARCSGGC